jgi:hypothetical protein
MYLCLYSKEFLWSYRVIKKSLCTWWLQYKNSMYSNNPHRTDDLKMTITEYIRNVDRAILNTVFENTVRRVNKCLETGGGALWTLLVTFCIVIIRYTGNFWSPCIFHNKKGEETYTDSCYHMLLKRVNIPRTRDFEIKRGVVNIS